MSPEQERELSQVVVKHMLGLRDDLARFEQTTHGRLAFRSVFDDLEMMFDRPTAHLISDFCQAVDYFAREFEVSGK